MRFQEHAFHVRIRFAGAAAFARFDAAAFCASPPMGSPSMSRTSRPDAIVRGVAFGPAMGEGGRKVALMDLQGCAKMLVA